MQKIYLKRYMMIGLSTVSLFLAGMKTDIDQLKALQKDIDDRLKEFQQSSQAIHENLSWIRHEAIEKLKELNDDETNKEVATILVNLNAKIAKIEEETKKSIAENNEKLQIQLNIKRQAFKTFTEQQKKEELAHKEKFEIERAEANKRWQHRLHSIELEHQQAKRLANEKTIAQQAAAKIAKKEATDQSNQRVKELIDQTKKSELEIAKRIQKWNDEHPDKSTVKTVPEQKSNSILVLLKSLTTKENLWSVASKTVLFSALLCLMYNYQVIQNYFNAL
ncbi:MAG TPA: hypothetical protein VLB80_03760 [Candidatus Babeliales bacterium]|nr:hypothetical protein [Candidatus Babeliales bacterium]